MAASTNINFIQTGDGWWRAFGHITMDSSTATISVPFKYPKHAEFTGETYAIPVKASMSINAITIATSITSNFTFQIFGL